MKKYMVLIISVLVVFSCKYSFAQTTEFRYAVFDLGDFGGQASNAFGINDAGIVVGNAWLPGNFIFHTALFDVNKGTITDLGTLGGQTSWAYEINERGQIVGVSDNINGFDHPYFWEDGIFTDLGTFGGTYGGARSINELGQIVGNAQLDDNLTTHAFLWKNNVMSDLGSLLNNQATSDAWDINETGQIVGLSSDETGFNTAILWENGNMINLEGLGGPFQSEAWAINDFGNIAGWSLTANNKQFAVIWDGLGGIMNLHKGNTRFFSSSGFGINNQDQVVGTLNFSRNGDFYGMLWEPTTGMHVLDDLMPPIPEMNTWTAYDINENGQIAAWGILKKSGWFRALMLSPVDPEMVLSDPVPGVAGVVNSWTVTGAAPGGKVTFVYGFKGGGTRVPGCDVLDAAVQIDEPRVVKTVVADGSGVAKLDMLVPGVAKNLGGILVQAVSLDVCQESQLRVVKFE